MIRILTDSAADLTPADRARPGVTVVPLQVVFSNGDTALDGEDITGDAYYERLKGEEKLPRTSQPSPDQFIEVFEQARAAGIVVIAHEGASLVNVDYDIEAFNNAAYGAFIMENLAQAMGGEGVYTTMVAHVTNASHNEWADGGVAYATENYPNMTLLEEEPRVESEDNGDVAYNVAKELFNKYPDLKGIMGTSSFDAPGVARAIEELGLTGKVFTSGTGMPADNAELLKSGAVQSLTLWDPALAGQAMIALAEKLLAGEEITTPLDLGVEGYTALEFREGSETVLEGEGWMVITAENVDSLGF